jgi:t-SNARE complex subunit (syntaxin)
MTLTEQQLSATSSEKSRHRELILIRVASMNRNIFYIIGVIVVIVIVLKLLGVF